MYESIKCAGWRWRDVVVPKIIQLKYQDIACTNEMLHFYMAYEIYCLGEWKMEGSINGAYCFCVQIDITLLYWY